MTGKAMVGLAALALSAGSVSAAISFSQDFSAPLDSGVWSTTTANGGSAEVANGKLVVGPLSNNGEKAYISYNGTGSGSGTTGSIKAEFDVKFNAHFTPNATHDVSYDTLFAVYNQGNNPVVGMWYGPNDWIGAYQFSMQGGIQWFGGTQTGNSTATPSVASVENSANGFHVTVLSDITSTGGLGWLLQNSISFTDLDTNTVAFTMDQTISGNAADDGYNPITGPLSFRLGTVDYSKGAPLFSGNLVFDNFAVSAPVPEPASLGLLALGSLALLRRR